MRKRERERESMREDSDCETGEMHALLATEGPRTRS